MGSIGLGREKCSINETSGGKSKNAYSLIPKPGMMLGCIWKHRTQIKIAKELYRHSIE